MTDLFAIEGKTFLVTGAASGLGALQVESFIKEGAKAVAILDVQVDNGNKLAERLNNSYSTSKVIFVKCDISDEKEADDAFSEVLNEFKQLDVIINNAAIMIDTPTWWRKATNVNWQGLIDFTLKGIKHMRKDAGGAGGTIINTSSSTALSNFHGLPIYSSTKLGVLHFSKTISVSIGATSGYWLQGGGFHERTGIRIMTICYGATATPLLEGLASRAWDESTVDDLESKSTYRQKPESALAGLLKVYKEGPNGSVWIAVEDKPAKNIRSIIDAAFVEFEKAMSE